MTQRKKLLQMSNLFVPSSWTYCLRRYETERKIEGGHRQQCSGVLLALHSGITLAVLRETICIARDKIWVGHMQDTCLTCCAISSTPFVVVLACTYLEEQTR